MSAELCAGVSAQVLDQAAAWMVRLHSGDISEHDRRALDSWRAASTEHEQAWRRAQTLLQSLDTLPASLGDTVLRQQGRARRKLMARSLALLLTAPAAAWLANETTLVQAWRADFSTRTGERRRLVLDDGTELTLNTDSAVDVEFSATQRLIVLRHGEILVETGADEQASGYRPFLVRTQNGAAAPLGTRFTVRLDAGHTRVAVLQHRVRVAPTRNDISLTLAQGEWASFDADRILAQGNDAEPADTAWQRGMLVANRRPLGRIVDELARYHIGWLRCDPAIAQKQLSGVFPVDDVPRALEMIAGELNLKVRRLTRYWLVLEAAQT